MEKSENAKFKLQFCRKINDDKRPIHDEDELARIPSINAYYEKDNSITLNIFSYIPTDIEKSPTPPEEKRVIDLLNDGRLYFVYSGDESFPMANESNEQFSLSCGEFFIDYYDKRNDSVEYDLYHIRVSYFPEDKNDTFTRGISFREKNIDPKTTRGTVTTVRKLLDI